MVEESNPTGGSLTLRPQKFRLVLGDPEQDLWVAAVTVEAASPAAARLLGERLLHAAEEEQGGLRVLTGKSLWATDMWLYHPGRGGAAEPPVPIEVELIPETEVWRVEFIHTNGAREELFQGDKDGAIAEFFKRESAFRLLPACLCLEEDHEAADSVTLARRLENSQTGARLGRLFLRRATAAEQHS